jgi:hypothetical protein
LLLDAGFMLSVDFSILNVALPQLGAGVGLGLSALPWVRRTHYRPPGSRCCSGESRSCSAGADIPHRHGAAGRVVPRRWVRHEPRAAAGCPHVAGVPVAVLILVATPFLVCASSAPSSVKLDVPGAVRVTLGLLAFTFVSSTGTCTS